MYSPSPPPAAAPSAYSYLNHQQTLSPNPYTSHTSSLHHGNGAAPSSSGTLSNLSIVPGANVGASPAAATPPTASSSYAHSSAFNPMGSSRFANSNASWMSRVPLQQQPHISTHHGNPSVSAMPSSLSHSVGATMAPSSPGYSTMGTSSPHAMSLLSSSLSPAASQPAQGTTNTAAGPPGASLEWQQQILCAEISRQSFSPHHHARAAALAARSSGGVGQDAKKGIQLPAGAAANGLSFPLQSAENKTAEDAAPGASPTKHSSLRTSKTATEGDENTSWSIIDMGGLNMPKIGPDVFRYTFLTSLFINHNNLTSIPAAVVQLRNLSTLDASGNKLVMIPSELGMLTGLKGLFLFDNRLTVLPPELGTLYQLDMLGIEGNPLQENLLSIIRHGGTQKLITFLRDSCPVPVPPPEREWVALDADVQEYTSEADAEANTFAVFSYNVLCDKYATAHMYGYTPSWALAWEYRKEFILQEIMSYGADICCLQEVEMGQFEDYFEPKLQQNEYEGIFWPKSRARTMRDEERRHVDGCATFFNSRVYKLVDKQLIEFNQIALQRPDFKKTEDIFNRVMTKDNVAAIAMLEHRTTGAKLLVANSHMHWDPEFCDVKLVQAAMLMEQLESASNRFAKAPTQVSLPERVSPPKYASGKHVPTVVCGDFNSTPDSGVYEFVSQGTAPADHADFMGHKYGSYTSEGLKHSLSLRSAYSNVGELSFTNHTPGFRGVIDYIWYSSNSLAASGLLGEVDLGYLSRVVGFPNAHFPSEYVCLFSPR
ncbi:poly(A)-specific ribonuclease [Malassezia sp. CBS 17886]|nr:poly(A)-specific ribonuclease [Malassezia sp. CBS 17886]